MATPVDYVFICNFPHLYVILLDYTTTILGTQHITMLWCSNSNIKNVFLSILQCEAPNSFYVVYYTNNQIVVIGVTYTSTRGNYNTNTMIRTHS
jgi:hypothetical protein